MENRTSEKITEYMIASWRYRRNGRIQVLTVDKLKFQESIITQYYVIKKKKSRRNC